LATTPLAHSSAFARDHRAHEREVVHVGARADADLSFPLRIGEVLVVADLLRIDGALEVEDRAGADGEGEPEAVRMAQLAGDAFLEHRGLHRLEEAHLLGAPEAAGVDRHEHVGGAARALVPQALEERVLVGLDAVHLDSGLLREVGVEGLVRLVMARGIEVQDLLLGDARQGEREARDERDEAFHGSSGG
jgi:hypothetical protein